MLSVFLVIFGSIGIFLNWPIIKEGLFKILTTPWNTEKVIFSIEQYSSGYSRLDGDIIIGISVIILISSFIRTTKTLLNLRILFLTIISAILAAELFTVIRLEYPFYLYTGLVYSAIFYLLAFVTALLRIGSMKSLNSTFMGKPMSESRVFSQTFSKFLNNASKVLQLKFTAEDDIRSDWNTGVQKEFENKEIKIGRDHDWADLRIGSKWGLVSNKHAIIRIIGNSVVYEPVSGHYAFAIDGTPHTAPREISSEAKLSLVSGSGPHFKIGHNLRDYSIMHPKSILRAGEIAKDEFKRLQTTFKILVVMVFLAIPLLWIFSGTQKKHLNDYISKIKHKNEQYNGELKEKIQEINELDKVTKKSKAEISVLRKKIKNLEEMGYTDGYEVERTREKIEKLKDTTLNKSISKEIKKFAKIVNIKFTSQRISIYFPFIAFKDRDKVSTGTAFFLKERSGKISMATEKALVFSDQNKKLNRAYFFIYPETWRIYNQYYKTIKKGGKSPSRLYQELQKISGRINLMVIDGRKWKVISGNIDGNGIVKAYIRDFPNYLVDYVPKIDTSVSLLDRVAVYGFFSGDNFYSVGNIGNLSPRLLRVNSATKRGFSSGFLIKIFSNGKYSVIGITNSQGKERYLSRLYFLRF